MTSQLHTRYCAKCKTGTPHEIDDTGDVPRGRCTVCANKQIHHAALKRRELADEIQRHIDALDGMGNRGPDSQKGRKQ